MADPLEGTSPACSQPEWSAEDEFSGETAPPTREGARDVAGEWPAFIGELIDIRPHLGSFLSHALLVAVHQHAVDLRFPHAFTFHFKEVCRPANRQILEQALSQFAARPLQVHVTLEDPVQSAPDREQEQLRTGQGGSLADDIHNEPIIETVLELFDGEVLD